jgi:acyl dehydratase
MTRFFEDVHIGENITLGSHTFSRDEIVEFAQRFDPQRFHIDEEAATASPFGGLIASGWQTGAVWMRLMAEHRQRAKEVEKLAPDEHQPRTGPSPGLRELKWILPVRPGDIITYSSRVVEKNTLFSRPNWGVIASLNEGVNQKGELVLSFIGEILVERRSPRTHNG